MRSRKRVTIREVACRAGVSTATVSRVMNQSGFVSEELTQRVLRAMQELQYFPNRLARSLKKQESFTVAYLVPDIDNPIFAKVVRGIQDVMEEVSYDVFIYNTRFSDIKLSKHLASLLENHPRGIIISAWHSERVKEAVSFLQSIGIPTVIVHSPRDIPGVDAILVDDVQGGYEATRYLLSIGHQRILSLGVVRSTTSMLREEGYRKAMEEAGNSSEHLILKAPSFSPRDGYAIVRAFLDKGIPITAIFAHSDSLALGALEAVHERGLAIPQDISIMGFDGAYASFTVPRLTTMLIPNYEMGKKAAMLLLSRIQGTSSVPSQELFAPTLFVQASTKPL
ncbi:MAG: LacI family transcriptional regulator [Candidatus Caldatribacterium sp.]|uniref:LacI family DNA-binding transcriptional regulator n=1 Tax=Candidatus Caldatribacterium sp. TaxID=2282143 RepID=UPI0029925381|nr:LacI family transcriptional regulator [Candidatus Caldatribacterium sp.]MCX7729883.1 LacI family transcriptional regulator [Candidatus Caldatribacterium sp.]MDW8081629.1 LacI family DNA-binding transcriptional regulator [Candidatus Calescibacterium sp.]